MRIERDRNYKFLYFLFSKPAGAFAELSETKFSAADGTKNSNQAEKFFQSAGAFFNRELFTSKVSSFEVPEKLQFVRIERDRNYKFLYFLFSKPAGAFYLLTKNPRHMDSFPQISYFPSYP